MINSGRHDEQGVALVFAIVVTILVVGFLAIFTLSSVSSRDERKTERARLQSEVWADAAATDLAARLESGEIGTTVRAVTVDGKRGRELFPVRPGATAAYEGGATCAPSFPITTGSGSGFYCVRPPAAGLTRGTGFLNLDATDPEHGTVTFVVRAWGSTGQKPIDVELRFGRESLSRYAVLSDAPIWLDNRSSGGTLTLPSGSRLHSNNTSNADYGIYMRGSVNHAAAARITATRARRGRAVLSTNGAPACPNGNKCYISGKTVSFNSTYTAFNRVAAIDPGGSCTGPSSGGTSAARMCRIPSSLLWGGGGGARTTFPMFVVDVNPPGASWPGCISWIYASYSLRTDSYSYPIPDDSVAPSYDTTTRPQICPARNGGGTALLFEGDVMVRGVRPAGAPGMTIMARRPQNNPNQRVRMPGGNISQVTEAASIYVAPVGGMGGTVGGNGTGVSSSPLGLVAEGGVYMPTYGARGNLRIQNSSIIAAGSGFSLGPAFQLVAGDTSLTVADETGAEIPAGGLNPCSATTLPVGGAFTFSGTFASRQVPFISYDNGTCFRGYRSRSYLFNTELGWNPPPFFPAPSPWHLVDSRVFST